MGKDKASQTAHSLYDQTIGRVINFFTGLWDNTIGRVINFFKSLVPSSEKDDSSGSSQRLYEVRPNVQLMRASKWQSCQVVASFTLFAVGLVVLSRRLHQGRNQYQPSLI